VVDRQKPLRKAGNLEEHWWLGSKSRLVLAGQERQRWCVALAARLSAPADEAPVELGLQCALDAAKAVCRSACVQRPVNPIRCSELGLQGREGVGCTLNSLAGCPCWPMFAILVFSARPLLSARRTASVNSESKTKLVEAECKPWAPPVAARAARPCGKSVAFSRSPIHNNGCDPRTNPQRQPRANLP
jgi:hypothetical protein